VIRGEDGGISRVCYVLPRHKAANWVGPGRGRMSTRPGASSAVELSPCDFLDRLADLVPPPRKHRHRPAGGWRGGRAKPRLWLRPPEAAGAMDGPAAVKQARGVRPESQAQVRRHRPPTTPPGLRGRNSWRGGGGVSFCVPGVWWRHPTQRRRPAGAGSLRTGGSQAGEGQDAKARVKITPGASRRTARTTARLAGLWPAHRLGRARAGLKFCWLLVVVGFSG
jgi:hypothetical protein